MNAATDTPRGRGRVTSLRAPDRKPVALSRMNANPEYAAAIAAIVRAREALA